MRCVFAEQMRMMDRQASEEGGIPNLVLMENAGRAARDAMRQTFGSLKGKRIVLCCGSGNNGGDGFALARYLHLDGAKAEIRLVRGRDRLSDISAKHLEIAEKMGVPIHSESHAMLMGEAELVVDALLGTGVKGAATPPISDWIKKINACGRPVIALDTPSGLDCDTGCVPGEAVQADLTVTFGLPKIGLLLLPGARYVGKLVIDPIGNDWSKVLPNDAPIWLDADEVVKWLPLRPIDAHKGTFGHLLIVGGSRGMSGAPILAARAALRAGVGLVTVAAPESVQAVVASSVPTLMTIPLPDRNGALSESAYSTVMEMAASFDAAVVGCGLSQQPEAASVAVRLASDLPLPVVIDADALNAIASNPVGGGQVGFSVYPRIFTPHPGEAARLLGTRAADIQSNRLAAVRELVDRYRVTAVLKGSRTLIGAHNNQDGWQLAVNTTGNPGMATAGSGDALSGVIGALLAAGMSAAKAAASGVYLHGVAGDLAARETGLAGLTTDDLIDRIGPAIKELEEKV